MVCWLSGLLVGGSLVGCLVRLVDSLGVGWVGLYLVGGYLVGWWLLGWLVGQSICPLVGGSLIVCRLVV